MNRPLIRCALVAAFALSATASFAADTVRYLAPGKAAVVLDAKALAALPRSTVQAGAHGAAPTAWEGVPLVELLRAEGAPLDKALRGDALASFVRVTASDGYQVVFSLGELDTGLGGSKVLLVDKHEGKPLDDKDGPFRLVVPADSRPARWVRQVESIELIGASTRPPKP